MSSFPVTLSFSLILLPTLFYILFVYLISFLSSLFHPTFHLPFSFNTCLWITLLLLSPSFILYPPPLIPSSLLSLPPPKGAYRQVLTFNQCSIPFTLFSFPLQGWAEGGRGRYHGARHWPGRPQRRWRRPNRRPDAAAPLLSRRHEDLRGNGGGAKTAGAGSSRGHGRGLGLRQDEAAQPIYEGPVHWGEVIVYTELRSLCTMRCGYWLLYTLRWGYFVHYGGVTVYNELRLLCALR